MQGGAEVELRIAGKDYRCRAHAIADDLERIAAYLEGFLDRFPQDAPYLGLQLGKDKVPLAGELERVARETVLIEAVPL